MYGVRCNAAEVVAVIPVVDALVVADRGAALPDERATAYHRPGRPLVAVHANESRVEVAALDHVVDAGGLAGERAVRPLGVHASIDVRPDAQTPEGRACREMLDVDADGRAIDGDVLYVRARVGGSSPDAAHAAIAHARPLQGSGATEPEAGLGRPIRRPRDGAHHLRDREVLEHVRDVRPVAILVRIDQDAVAPKRPRHDSLCDEALGLPHDEAGIHDAVAVQPRVPNRGMRRRAPDVDDRSLERLRWIVDVEPDSPQRGPGRARIRTEH